MRHLTSLLSSRMSARRPVSGRGRQDEKRTSDPKAAPKRCLNEAAHKLNR